MQQKTNRADPPMLDKEEKNLEQQCGASPERAASLGAGLCQMIRSEFKWENLSLSFEKNSSFQAKDPEEVLEYFHSSIVSGCKI